MLGEKGHMHFFGGHFILFLTFKPTFGGQIIRKASVT